MGLIQHKREAYWFYRFLSLGYDRWVNPLFWTHRDARPRPGGRPAGRARAGRARRGRRDRVHHRGDRRARRPRAGDDARPEPAPARPRAPQARAGGLPEAARRRRAPPLRGRDVRPVRLRREHRVLARPAARDHGGAPRPAQGRDGRRDRPRRALQPAAAPALGRVDAVPARGRLPRLVRAGRLRGRSGARAGPRLVPRPLRLRRRGQRHQTTGVRSCNPARCWIARS